MRLGYFDEASGQPYRQYGPERINSRYNQALALQAGLESVVLLKNDADTLPYPSSVLSIALIGPNADVTETLLGNYDAPSPYIISILHALQSRSAKVTHAAGCTIAGNSTAGFAAAVSAAAAADFTIFVGGLDQSQEAEGRDRTLIDLPGQQGALVQAIAAAAKKPIAAVFLGGGQVDLSELKLNPKVGALLWAGYPGQSGGEAIVQVLNGQHSPSGRLPSTQYPADYIRRVPMTDQSFRPSSSSPGRTYRFYTEEAVYPFGHGLSYTSLRYVGPAAARVASSSQLLGADPSPIAYSVNVTNTGKVRSDVTVLAYLTYNSTSAQYPTLSPPLRQLFDFQFIPMLAPGATQQVFFQLTANSLKQVDERGHEWLLPGHYEVHVNEGHAKMAVQVVGGGPRLVRRWEGSEEVVAPAEATAWHRLAHQLAAHQQ